MNFLNDTNVLVLGLGDSGLAMARWCARCGAHVRVWDSRDAPPQAQALAEHVPGARLLGGALTADAFDGVQLVLRSPGLSPADERIAQPLEQAAETGVLVQSELELFARALADLKAERGYAPKLIAITGTNGKTTTTAMATQLIARAGRRVAMAGNIGPTMLQTLADALDREPAVPAVVPQVDVAAQAPMPVRVAVEPALMDSADEDVADLHRLDGGGDDIGHGALGDEREHATPAADSEPAALPDDDAPLIAITPPPPAAQTFEHLPEVWVLELSSFQLHEAKGFEPHAATVLNITQDHLDWHGTMAAYTAAKARAFGKQAVMVINRDDAAVERLVPEPVPVKGRNAKPIVRDVRRFGLTAPTRAGDYGVVESNGMAWLVRALEADPTVKRAKRAKADPAEEEDELHLQHLMPADALRVRGRHNAANALAALALATAIGCPLAPMLHGLREYSGEPHRVEHLASVGGVDAFDDSKGTNVGATVAALNGLGADKSPGRLVVILGGDGKGQDFAPLLEPVRAFARAVATLGRDAERIEAALAGSGVPVHRHATLEAATRWCFEQAQTGDAVLLSPACASLDMFRNYAHRAEVFAGAVQQWAAEQGALA
ncbi:MAG: UDP-N-acetylmuramoylalanine--D-glutamate ligase [Methylibium sp. NZG]|nr:MAG: UDP-N-acetylmuramoylalanine--D-glutamate ligase [Methylibium sp. NZG]